MSELRWNPLLREWVATATHRQDRTFLPPEDFCPLCPTNPGGFPTEIPGQDYDIVVFENRFPSLRSNPEPPSVESSELYPVELGRGVCEVVLYAPRHHSSLAQESTGQIHKLIQVWRNRFQELSALDFVKYVFIFENKGEAIGVTLHHPHGQIYGYPFIPPRIRTELDSSLEHHNKSGRCLLCDILLEEQRDGRRIILENDSFSAYIPFFARWPYEVHIVSRRHLQTIAEFQLVEERLLAEILKSLLVGYDRLFNISFPYMMVLHQGPSDGNTYPYYHFHIEFYPPLRSASRLKYLAGSETGAGMFINDTLAEEKARELRSLISG